MPGAPPAARRRLVGIVGRLSSVNLFIACLGLVTGPLQARALGADGRGDLAAILVPLGLAPVLANLGLGTFAIREAARGREPSSLVGSLMPVLIVVGLVTAILGPVTAAFLAEGRETVEMFLVIGFCLVPVGLCADLFTSIAVGQERWRVFIAVRLLPPVVLAVGITCLFLVGRLTTATAALLSLAASPLVFIPLFSFIRSTGVPRFSKDLMRSGLRFGFPAWLGGLGSVANVRLDQLLMIRLVSPADLGLYVVAVTASGFLVAPVLGAITSGAFPRLATAGTDLTASVVRVSLFGAAAIGATLALILPFLIPLVFGSEFSGSVELAWILLAAGVPLAGVNALSTALTASGHPRYSAASELLVLAITVPCLLLLLPRFGATGAAYVSLLAYSASFLFLLSLAARHLGGGCMQFVAVRRADIVSVGRTFASRARRLRRRRRAS